MESIELKYYPNKDAQWQIFGKSDQVGWKWFLTIQKLIFYILSDYDSLNLSKKINSSISVLFGNKIYQTYEKFAMAYGILDHFESNDTSIIITALK